MQVLSFSVSKGLTHNLGSTADVTAEFAIMFDKFSYAKNVSNFDIVSATITIQAMNNSTVAGRRILDGWERSVQPREGFTDPESF